MRSTRLLTLMAIISISSLSHGEEALGLTKHPLPDSGTPYGYLAYLPPSYDANTGKHPLVIFLHGLGELGDGNKQLNNVAKHGPFKHITKDPKIFAEASAVVLAPQGLKADKWWELDKLEAFLDHALKEYAIDKDRVYLTGLSMGGGATWQLANKRPKTFAAIAPICGASKPDKKLAIADIPIWAFHSIGDGTVPFDNSRQWLEASAGKSKNELMADYPRTGNQSASFDGRKWTWTQGQNAPSGSKQLIGLTVYPDKSHNSWARAYQDPALWTWLFAQKR